MAFTGIQPLIANYIYAKTLKNSSITWTIIIGILIPDIDVLFSLIGIFFKAPNISIALFTNKFTHSLFIIILIYFIGLIIKEISNKKQAIIISRDIIIGITIHIIIDVLLSNQTIYLLWPLNIKFNLLSNFNVSSIYTDFLKIFDFIFFRFYGWYVITKIIEDTKHISIFIHFINKWMKIEIFISIIMFLLFIIKFKYFEIVWLIFFTPSIIIALLITYLLGMGKN